MEYMPSVYRSEGMSLICETYPEIRSALPFFINSMKMTLLCLLNTLLMAMGQMLFKAGSRGKELHGILDILRLFYTPIVLGALCLYAATTGLWLYILNRTPISHAYPIQALAFPIVLLASMAFFQEQVSLTKWVGVAIIVLGVFIATRG